MLLLSLASIWAGSATWSENPASGDWNTGANWTPAVAPDATAAFGASNTTNLTTSAITGIHEVLFRSGASTYNIATGVGAGGFFNSLNITDAGVTNNSGVVQKFLGSFFFFNNATAGSLTAFLNEGIVGGYVTFIGFSNAGSALFTSDRQAPLDVEFDDSTSANNGTFICNGATQEGGDASAINFLNSSTAAHGSFTVGDGPAAAGGEGGGQIHFEDDTTAADGVFVINGGSARARNGGFVQFDLSSSAGNATFIVNGGLTGGGGGEIIFIESSSANAAQIKVFGNGGLDISEHEAPGLVVGSLQGDGLVFLGSNNLTFGANNTSTTISGTIQDGGAGGSITKLGTGTVILSGFNTFTGPTIIKEGTVTAAADHSLGAGNVNLMTGAKLILRDGETNNYLSDSGTLTIVSGSMVELNFSGASDHIGHLSVDGHMQPAGLYGSNTSKAEHKLPQLDGSGTLLVGPTTPTPTPTPVPIADLLNISTRMRVLTGDNVLIGGFIITGSAPKKVLVRGIGPSLTSLGVTGALADPVLELHQPNGKIVTNDNWKETQQAAITALQLAPNDEKESAILATLAPGAYTAIVRGKNGGTGISLVEVYDVDPAGDSTLANISTRGFVETGDNVMIGGVIVGGTHTKVLVRALGPELTTAGVTGALADPTLELHNADGSILASNDNWKDTQQAEIAATKIAPKDNKESAILATLPAGAYTAIVRGKNNTSGVALVEVYNLNL